MDARSEVEAVAAGADEPAAAPVDVNISNKTIRTVLVGIFLVMLVGVFYFAQDFLLPVALAFLLMLVLSPIVRALKRRHVPEGLTATALVLGLTCFLGAGLYFLSGPVTQWVQDAPSIAFNLQTKIQELRGPVEAIAKASGQIENIAEGEPEPGVETVVLREPGLLSRAASGAPEIAAKVLLTMVLLLFLLASGDMFYDKIVRVLPTFADKKRAVRIVRDVERVVSRYLLTVTVINTCLGIAIGCTMWVLDMPTPLLWGVLGGLLNFIPYIGALVGIVLTGLVAVVSLDTLGQALMVPAAYVFLTTVEGQIVTPMVVGRRLEINEVAIFIAVAFWGWLWGIVGALIAVPFLVIVKVFSDHVESLSSVGEFLAGRHVSPPQEAEPTDGTKPNAA